MKSSVSAGRLELDQLLCAVSATISYLATSMEKITLQIIQSVINYVMSPVRLPETETPSQTPSPVIRRTIFPSPQDLTQTTEPKAPTNERTNQRTNTRVVEDDLK